MDKRLTSPKKLIANFGNFSTDPIQGFENRNIEDSVDLSTQ